MPRRYDFDELNITTLPRITKGVWMFSDRRYTYRCVGRTSRGYGTTPADAYSAWLRNLAAQLDMPAQVLWGRLKHAQT